MSETVTHRRIRQLKGQLTDLNLRNLEHMLVRAQDAPILEQSQGKLEWIVLDGAARASRRSATWCAPPQASVAATQPAGRSAH